MPVHGNADMCGQGEAQFGLIQQGHPFQNNPGSLKPLYPSGAGCGRQTDTFGKLEVAQTGIALQQVEDFQVDAVKL